MHTCKRRNKDFHIHMYSQQDIHIARQESIHGRIFLLLDKISIHERIFLLLDKIIIYNVYISVILFGV